MSEETPQSSFCRSADDAFVRTSTTSSGRSANEQLLAAYRTRFGYYNPVVRSSKSSSSIIYQSDEYLLPITARKADRFSILDDVVNIGQWQTQPFVVSFWQKFYSRLFTRNGVLVRKRNCHQCCQAALFYLCLYVVIFLPILPISFAYRYLFMSIDRPKHSSLILSEPGLNFRPRPAESPLFSNLIQFNRNDRTKYLKLVKDINSAVKTYEPHNHTSGPYTEDMETYWTKVCSFDNPADSVYACRLNTQNFGTYCYRNMEYGYMDGAPCILIRPNKVYGWKPEPYQSFEELMAAGFPLQWRRKDFDSRYLPISCIGDSPVDRELLGPVKYFYPFEAGKQGMPTYFFPYLNQKNFQAPGVMVNFWNVTTSVVVRVVCQIWAKNIPHHREGPSMMPRGGVKFEVMVDNGIVEKWADEWPSRNVWRGRGRGMEEPEMN